jgi:hypothetical protein
LRAAKCVLLQAGRLNPIPFEAAAESEKDLADDLRRAEYTVTGGH